MVGRVHFRVFFLLLTLAVLGLAVGSTIYIIEKIEKPRQEKVQAIQSAPQPKPIDPGIGEFDAAMALIRNRQYVAARDRLRYIIRYFPNSERYDDARHVCGEINVDLALSRDQKEGKTDYEVKRGDAISRIASEQNTTLEYIKRTNGLLNFNIRPEDQLTVKALDFDVTIEKGDQRLILEEAGEFFKEYPVRKFRLPARVPLPTEETVRGTAAILGDENLPPMAKGFDEANKSILLKRPGMALREMGAAENAAEETGIFLDPADVDELAVLLRPGTTVNILP